MRKCVYSIFGKIIRKLPGMSWTELTFRMLAFSKNILCNFITWTTWTGVCRFRLLHLCLFGTFVNVCDTLKITLKKVFLWNWLTDEAELYNTIVYFVSFANIPLNRSAPVSPTRILFNISNFVWLRAPFEDTVDSRNNIKIILQSYMKYLKLRRTPQISENWRWNPYSLNLVMFMKSFS